MNFTPCFLYLLPLYPPSAAQGIWEWGLWSVHPTLFSFFLLRSRTPCTILLLQNGILKDRWDLMLSSIILAYVWQGSIKFLCLKLPGPVTQLIRTMKRYSVFVPAKFRQWFYLADFVFKLHIFSTVHHYIMFSDYENKCNDCWNRLISLCDIKKKVQKIKIPHVTVKLQQFSSELRKVSISHLMLEQNLELNTLIAPPTVRFKSNKPQAVSTYFVNRWAHQSVSYPMGQQSVLSCMTEEVCCEWHWHVLQLTLQAVTRQKSPHWHYTSVVWTESRTAVLSGYGLWNKAVLQEEQTKTKTLFLHCTMQICQVSESPCLPHFA